MPLPVSWRARESILAEIETTGIDWKPTGWYWPSRMIYADRPEIVTLCGSTRFVEQFNEQRKRLTHEGIIVLSIEIVTSQMYDEDPQHVNRANKEMLDQLHLEKIKISDRIFVINVNLYIGESTAKEIKFAQSLGIPITYLELVQ